MRMVLLLLYLLVIFEVFLNAVCNGFEVAVSVSDVSTVRHPRKYKRYPLLQQQSLGADYCENDDDDDDDDDTVSSWTNPAGQRITLIGTAHLSQKSNDQVERVILDVQPNVVMVELDPARLSRIGIPSLSDIQNVQVITSADIALPTTYGQQQSQQPWYWLLRNGLALIGRRILTSMYNDMSSQMNNEDGGGAEFLVAIRAAESCTACTKLILGDRDSLITIQRAVQLAIDSGNPFQVLQKLSEANAQEMQQLELKVREELGGEGHNNNDDNYYNGEFQRVMMERLKSDKQVRNRLFHRLEQDVPEFTQAFLRERDYIMSRVIAIELEKDPTIERVVAVVGLAHVPGIKSNLQAMFPSPSIITQ